MAKGDRGSKEGVLSLFVSSSSLIFSNRSLLPSIEDDEPLPALLDSEGAGMGEVGAADAPGAGSMANPAAPEVRPSSVSVMARAPAISQVVRSRWYSATLEQHEDKHADIIM